MIDKNEFYKLLSVVYRLGLIDGITIDRDMYREKLGIMNGLDLESEMTFDGTKQSIEILNELIDMNEIILPIDMRICLMDLKDENRKDS